MIAAAKKAIARTFQKASDVVLLPLAVLIAKITKANRMMVRWAVRNRSRFVYLFALYWTTTTMFGLLLWGMIAIHPEDAGSGTILAVVTFALVFVKKVLLLGLYAVQRADDLVGYWRRYRRQFPALRDP